jgi:hypothetical protein
MKDIRSILIILLAVILMATWGFYIYDKSQSTGQIKEKIVTDSTDFKKAVQQAVEDSLKKVYAEAKHDTVFISKDSLAQKPPEDSINVTTGSEKIEKKITPKLSRSAFYFTATGINLSAITTKAGGKPEVTSLAKESEKFILSFVLQNNILPSSEYNIYVVVTQPDQKTIRNGETGNDYFYIRKEGLKFYTQKIHFIYIHKSKKTITCILKPQNFLPGIYTVKIYHNGEMIGQTYKQLQ